MNHPSPALFFAHGSPMNLITSSRYSRDVMQFQKTIQPPKAIVVVSSHYLSTNQVLITSSPQPKQLFDFYGFPNELYTIPYHPPGSPDLARRIQGMLGAISKEDPNGGLDHAVWAAGAFLFPEANIPVVSISVPMHFSVRELFAIGEKLRPLRNEWILCIGSGNVVHNFSHMLGELETIEHPSAITFEKACIDVAKHPSIDALEALSIHPLFRFAAPTLDHFAPFAVILGILDPSQDRAKIIHSGIQNASMSMLCVEWK